MQYRQCQCTSADPPGGVRRIRHVRVQADTAADTTTLQATLAQTFLSSLHGAVSASPRLPFQLTFTQPQPRFGAHYISLTHAAVVDGSLKPLSADSTLFVFQVEAEAQHREVRPPTLTLHGIASRMPNPPHHSQHLTRVR